MQSKTQKGPRQPEDKKKGKGKKSGGGKDKKPNKNVEGAKDEKRKAKFPCKLCGDDHLTHQCPKMEETQRLIKLQQQHPVVLKNPFPQGQKMQVGSSTFNPQGGTSSAPLSGGSFSFVNMLNSSKLKEEELDFRPELAIIVIRSRDRKVKKLQILGGLST